jgi:hypothetical protein
MELWRAGNEARGDRSTILLEVKDSRPLPALSGCFPAALAARRITMARVTHTPVGISVTSVLLLIGLLCPVLFLSCSGGLKTLKGEDRMFLTPEFWEDAESLFGDYGGGWWLREKANSIRWEGGNWYVRESHHYQLVVLDADKMRRYADWSIRFGASQTISEIKARTITAQGEVLPVESKDIHEKSQVPGFMLYADTKSKVFAMPGFADRSIIDIEFTRQDQALYFQDDYEFTSTVPVRKSRYSYMVDSKIFKAGFKTYYMDYNISVEPVHDEVESYIGKAHRWAWEMTDLDAVYDEPWMPARSLFAPRILVSGFSPAISPNDWSHFTEWYGEYLADLDARIPEAAETAGRLAEGAESRQEAIQRIVDYFGKNIRYVSIGLKESGLRPHHPTDVMRNKYGDCKDMSCLAISMLRSLGVKAYPALVLTKDLGRIEKNLVYIGFNHMIVFAETEGGEIWLDFTAAPFPVGYVPPADRGIDALVIMGKQGTWKTTPEGAHLETCISSMTQVSATPTGGLSGESAFRYTGDWGFLEANRFSAKGGTDLAEAVEKEVHGFLDAAVLDSCRLAFLRKSPPEVALVAGFSDDSRVVRVDDKLVIKPDFVNSLMHGFVSGQSRTERRFPLVLPFGWRQRDTTTVMIPQGWVVDKLPIDINSSGRYGAYAVSARERDGHILLISDQSIKNIEIPASEFEDFIDFWTKAKRGANQEVILKKL